MGVVLSIIALVITMITISGMLYRFFVSRKKLNEDKEVFRRLSQSEKEYLKTVEVPT